MVDKDLMLELVIELFNKEYRLSERQIRLLRWDDYNGQTLRTARGREIELSESLSTALSLIPKKGQFIFDIKYRPSLSLRSRLSLRKQVISKKLQAIPLPRIRLELR